MHILEQLGTSLDECKPLTPLRSIGNHEERHEHYTGDSFIWHTSTGESEWEMVGQPTHKRLIISADEGSPLYAGYRYLLTHGVAINVIRDNLYLVIYPSPVRAPTYVLQCTHLTNTHT